jgi:hypothetical protein
MSKKFIIITSINYPTKAIQEFSQFSDWQIVVVADLKTPQDWKYQGVKFLSVEEQENLGFESCKHMPMNHYARKNIGYLYAISQGAELIYETDDDNLPYDFWQDLLLNIFSHSTEVYTDAPHFINAYQHFSEKHVWPRGFPLTQILRQNLSSCHKETTQPSRQQTPILQGLADFEPDVDAIYRLTVGEPIKFDQQPPLYIAPGSYCPFNSQNTLWYPEAFQYLFLPTSVQSRVTDIWRGYIAQNFLHRHGQGVLFHAANVYQERNVHDLSKDFQDEIDLYTETERLVSLLEAYSNSYEGYVEYLESQKVLKSQDVLVFRSWLNDLRSLGVQLA